MARKIIKPNNIDIKNQTKSLLLFLLIGLFSLSCFFEHKIYCPDFDTNLLEWSPYKSGDSIVLFNTTGDSSITLHIDTIFIKHINYYSSNIDCGGCMDEININSTDSDFYLAMEIASKKIQSINFLIDDSEFYYFDLDLSQTTNYAINALTFEDVKIFTPDSQTLPNEKLVLAKGYGIIELTKKSGETWSIIQKKSSIDKLQLTPMQLTHSCF